MHSGIVAHHVLTYGTEEQRSAWLPKMASGEMGRGHRGGRRFVLAECDTVSSVGWAFLDDCALKHMRGELDIAGAAKAKLWLTDQQIVVADRCLQPFDGYGFMREYPLSQLFVDARVQKIFGGSNEIMK